MILWFCPINAANRQRPPLRLPNAIRALYGQPRVPRHFLCHTVCMETQSPSEKVLPILSKKVGFFAVFQGQVPRSTSAYDRLKEQYVKE